MRQANVWLIIALFIVSLVPYVSSEIVNDKREARQQSQVISPPIEQDSHLGCGRFEVQKDSPDENRDTSYECLMNQQSDDPEFSIVCIPIPELSDENDSASTVCIAILAGDSFPIGISRTQSSSMGIDTNSIRVHKLAGDPELLKIEWLDYPAGNGAYQHYYYQVRLLENSTALLLSGFVALSGHWSASEGILPGKCGIDYQGNLLTIKEEWGKHSYSDEPRVGSTRTESGSSEYIVQFGLTREYQVAADTIALISATAGYVIHDGDTVTGVCHALGIDSGWVDATFSLPSPGEWLYVPIPTEIAEIKYRAVNEISY